MISGFSSIRPSLCSWNSDLLLCCFALSREQTAKAQTRLRRCSAHAGLYLCCSHAVISGFSLIRPSLCSWNSDITLCCFICLVCGIYVDSNGRKCRNNEIMWPAAPTSISKYIKPYKLAIKLFRKCSEVKNVFSEQMSQFMRFWCLSFEQRWLGRMLDLGSKGGEFETHRRHCVVSMSMTLYSLFSTKRPSMDEKLLTGM